MTWQLALSESLRMQKLNDSYLWMILSLVLTLFVGLLYLIMKQNKQSLSLMQAMNQQNQERQSQLVQENQKLLNLAVSKNLETFTHLTTLEPQFENSISSKYDINRNDDETEAWKSHEDMDDLDASVLAMIPGFNV